MKELNVRHSNLEQGTDANMSVELHPSLNDVDIISLDVWKTVLINPPPFKLRRTAIFAKHLGYTGDNDILTDVIRGVSQKARSTSGSESLYGSIDVFVAAIYEELPTRIPELTQGISEAIRSDHENLMAECPPVLLEEDFPETLSTLTDLGFRFGLISNTGFMKGDYVRGIFKEKGIWENISCALFSDEVGFAKPNPNIFHMLAERENVDPNRIMHVGNNFYTDYLGARSAGLKALHLSTDADKRSEKIPTIRSLIGR